MKKFAEDEQSELEEGKIEGDMAVLQNLSPDPKDEARNTSHTQTESEKEESKEVAPDDSWNHLNDAENEVISLPQTLNQELNESRRN